jgi:hypothetical protein
MLDGKLYEVHPKKGGKILLTPTKFSLRTEVEGVMVSAGEAWSKTADGRIVKTRSLRAGDNEVPKGTLSDRVAESFPEGVGEPGPRRCGSAPTRYAGMARSSILPSSPRRTIEIRSDMPQKSF